MFLSDQEVAEMCAPLVSSGAQKRFLRSLGLNVNEKPNGRPLIVRLHAEAVLSGRPERVERDLQPSTGVGVDRDALLQVIRERQAARPNRRTGK